MMLRKTSLIILFLSFTSTAYADPLCALAPAGHDKNYDQNPGPIGSRQMQIVNNYLCEEYNCPRYEFKKNQTLQNAMATLDQTGNKIRYNSNFMAGTYSRYGELATIGVLAHELGHIIDFSTRRFNMPQAQREDAADGYAGCFFGLAGHTRSDLNGLVSSLQEMPPSPGYSTPQQRVARVIAGFNECANNRAQ